MMIAPDRRAVYTFLCNVFRFRVRVPTRVSSKKKEARGIFEHAKVVPGRDWLTPSDAQGTHAVIHLLNHCVIYYMRINCRYNKPLFDITLLCLPLYS